MTPDFFANVLEQYLENNRIESGVLRLELDDGRTRRLIIEEDTESLDPYEYLLRELQEIVYLIEENEVLFEETLELSIPVEDADRVVEEARADGAVTTLFQADAVTHLLEDLRAIVETKSE